MSIYNGFNNLPRVVQVILLLIPGVNWVTEILVRGSAALHGKGMQQVMALILAILLPVLFGWIDVIWCLLFNRLVLT